MPERSLPLFAAIALSLGSCAYAPFAPLVAEAVSEAANQPRYTGQELEAAAAEACRGEAARYGRVAITKVEPHGGNSMRVYGTIEDAYGGPARSFSCVFRSDGIIRYFRRH